MEKIALVGIIAVLAASLFRNAHQTFGLYIVITACILIFYFGMGKMQVIVNALSKIQSYLYIDSNYISILFKIIGITYISEFASSLCKDAGHQAIANQIEFAGKLCIMAVSMPVLLALLDTIDRFLAA